MFRRPLPSLLLVTSLASSLVGCSNASDTESPAAPTSSESAESAAQQAAFERPSTPPAAPAAPQAGAMPEAERIPFDPAHPAVAGLTWTAPSGFVHRAPESAMRLAEYVVGRAGDQDVAMTVFHFPGMGGSVDSNLTRWIGQFTQPNGGSTLAVTRSETTTVNGIRVTTVTTQGRFEGGTMGGGTGDDYRLLGAIAEATGGPVFFKLVGPRAIVDAAEPGFRALVASFAAVR